MTQKAGPFALRSHVGVCFFGLLLCPLLWAATTPEQSAIPKGTILPAILRTTISPTKVRQGQVIRAELAQDVPLTASTKIRKGSKIEGYIVDVGPIGNGSNIKISVRFDKLYSKGQPISITTNLRAIAGFMEVLDAQVPKQGPGEGDVAEWMTTMQIGGESVFGVGGPVTSADDATKVVGKSVNGGVLAEPNKGGKCRGSIDGNNAPQAFWVFSSDACGTYGLSKVDISHAGRTDPIGTVILGFKDSHTKIRSGAGLLLRVIT